jgi:hypothetical protein
VQTAIVVIVVIARRCATGLGSIVVIAGAGEDRPRLDRGHRGAGEDRPRVDRGHRGAGEARPRVDRDHCGDPRILLDPEVPDRALGYVLYLLRSLGAEPVSFDDPYLASVGLTEDDLARRRPGRLGVRLRRAGAGSAGVGGLGGVGLDFDHPSLTAWAAATS